MKNIKSIADVLRAILNPDNHFVISDYTQKELSETNCGEIIAIFGWNEENSKKFNDTQVTEKNQDLSNKWLGIDKGKNSGLVILPKHVLLSNLSKAQLVEYLMEYVSKGAVKL